MSTWTGRTFAKVRDRMPSFVRNPAELFLAKNSVLRTTGWLRSRRQKSSVNADGEPIPWITYPAIRFLEQRVQRSFRVFEFGSGLSTLWWAKRVSSVTSVEHDNEWHERVAQILPPNASIMFADGDAYVQSATGQHFDIVVVDGIRRPDCAMASISSLSHDGVILWDNTDELADRAGHLFMEEAGFKRLDFFGFGPLMVRESCTTIFYRPVNCLGI